MGFLKKFIVSLVLFALIVPLSSIPIPVKAAEKTSGGENKFQTHSADLETGKEIELTAERTRFSRTILKPDGVKQKMISSEPINYQAKENGQTVWKEIDSGLAETSAVQSLGSKQYNNRANDFNLRLSDDLYNQGVSLSKDNTSINMKLKSSLLSTVNASSLPLLSKTVQSDSVKPVLESNNKLSFKNVLKDTDIKYQSLTNGVKDEIVLNRYSGQNIFSFQLNLNNLYYKEIAPGAFAFYNTSTNKAVFYMPQSYMYDSLKSSEFPEGALSYDVKTEIIKNSNGYEIRLTANDKWLKDSARVYPITIDPSLNVGTENGEDSFVQSGYPTNLAWNQAALFLGRTSYYSKGVTRTFVNFNTDLTNARIYSARVSAYQYICNGSCQSSGVTARLTGGYDIYGLNWNNQPWVSDSVGHTSDNGVNKWIDMDVTTAARYWYQAGNPAGSMKGSLAFTQDNESSNGQRNWKATNSGEGLGPRLYIDYNDYSANYNVASVANARVDDMYDVGAAVYNSGRNTWNAGSYNLSYHIADSAGNIILRDGLRTALPYDIGPGGSASFTAHLKIPSTPGNYIVKWELIQENVTWFSDQGIPTFDYPITVTDYPEYDASYQLSNVPVSVASNTTINIPVHLHNGSRYMWTPDTFKVSYHWYDKSTNSYAVYDGVTTPLTGNVPSRNGDGSVNLQVKAPFNSGNYTLQVDMIRTGYGWFSNFGIPTANCDIAVSIPSFSSLTRLGTEDYYAKAGPVDLATGNLSYSSTDMAINSNSGLLSVERSYNANSLDQTYDQNSAGYIQNWLINGPYKENDQLQRLSKKYISNEETIRPNTSASTNGKLWLKANTSTNILDINQTLDANGVVQSGYASNSVVYANTYVYSPVSQTAKLKVGSDDGEKVWLNGMLISNQDVYRSFTIDQDSADVTLKQGWNTLLVKVSQQESSWLLSSRFINSTTNAPLTGLKYALDNQEVFGDYGLLGKGWTTNFNVKLFSTDENNVYYRDSTGSVNLFTKNADGTYRKPTGASIDLVKNTDGTFSLTSKSGIKINFNSIGRLASVVDLSGNAISYQYDTSGNCIKILDGGRFITLLYSGNQLVSISDQLGNKYQYTFDNAVSPSRLIKVVDPIGNSFSYTYSSNGKLATFTNKRGYATNISYDCNGKVIEIKDALGNSTGFSYSLHKTTVTDALGRSITGEFDSNNLLTAFTNQKKYREIYQYDGNYNVVYVYPDIPENDSYFYKYSYIYDLNSNLISESDPLGRTATYVYLGNDLIKKTDPDGSTAKFVYSTDGKRLLLSEQDAKLNTSYYAYDSKGNRLSITDSEGSVTKSAYSSEGDLIGATSPQNETSTYAYDTIGRKISETTSLNKTTTYSYSAMSSLIKMTDAGGLSTSYGYDQNGNVVKETNPNGASKQYAYSSLDQPTKITDEVGAVIEYQYDAVGNKTKTVDANGKVTSYTYDELNRMIGENQPSGGKSSVAYNRNSQPTKVTDPSGQVVSQEFNKSGEVSNVTDPESTTSYTYDTEGKVIKANSTNSGDISLTYDQNNNVTSVNSTTAGSSNIAYNKSDNPTLIQTPTSNVAITYNKDGAAQQVSSQVGAQTLTTQFVRDTEGKIASVNKPNGDTTFFSYDNSNRTTSIENRNKARSLLSKYYYQYDKASNITAINDAKSGTTTYYSYDARNQLLKEGNAAYSYDPMGNRKTVVDASGTISYTYDTAGDSNRLLKVTYPTGQTIQFEYDASGNIIKRIDSKAGTTLYTYDSDNYFTKAVLPSGNSVEYSYDKLLKLRIKRIEKDNTGLIKSITKFIYDGSRLVSETDDTGKVLRSYTWDQKEDLFSISIPDQNNILQTYSYVKNLKGDIIGLSDVNGNLVAEYGYDAWGNITKSVTNAKSTIVNLDKLNPRLYSSYWYDSLLGLNFMKTRMYDSSLGRFLSKDPLLSGGDALSYNPYVYCNNNPVSNIDPSGKGFWNSVTQFASRVVQTTVDVWNRAWDAVARGLENIANSNIPIISSIARGINKAADWTGGSWYKAAAIGLAVGAVVAAAIVAAPVVAELLVAGGSAIASAITGLVTVAMTSGQSIVDKINLTATNVNSETDIEEIATQAHHVIPKYIGGSALPSQGAILENLSSSYHLQITNAFRAMVPYGSPMASNLRNLASSNYGEWMNQASSICNQVYNQFPINSWPFK